MPLNEYRVTRDHFQFDIKNGDFCFPCIACIHRKKKETEDPCRTCDHNANAKPEDPT